MGGFYNMVFDRRPHAPVLLSLLSVVHEPDFGRIRDAWVEQDDDWIVIRVHTRNGGPNREDQKPAIDSMRTHPWFLHDADLEFDPTYADFYFMPPRKLEMPGDLAGHEEQIAKNLIALAEPPVDMNARWAEAIEMLKVAGPPPSMDPLLEQLKQAFGQAAEEGPDAPKDASSD